MHPLQQQQQQQHCAGKEQGGKPCACSAHLKFISRSSWSIAVASSIAVSLNPRTWEAETCQSKGGRKRPEREWQGRVWGDRHTEQANGQRLHGWMSVGKSGTYPPGADPRHRPGSVTGTPPYPARGLPVRPRLTSILAQHRLVRPGP